MDMTVKISFNRQMKSSDKPTFRCRLIEMSQQPVSIHGEHQEWEMPLSEQVKVLENLYYHIRVAVGCYNTYGTLPAYTGQQDNCRPSDEDDTAIRDRHKTPPLEPTGQCQENDGRQEHKSQ